MKKNLVIYFCTIIFLFSGCSVYRSSMSLDQVLEVEGKPRRSIYGYRCTVGAHRGASEDFLENTISALMAANNDPQYAFIEFDVQYSKDERIVVFHDKSLLRLFGNLRKISNTDFDKLRDVTKGEIVEYKDVLDVVDKKINIEIKSHGDILMDRKLVDEIVADLRSRMREQDVMLSSISSDVIDYIGAAYPDIPTGQIFWLTSSTYLPFDGLTKSLYSDIIRTQADYLLLHVANLRNIDDLLKLKPKDKTIGFWDFDDKMYIVHKDSSDRLWGESRMKAFSKSLLFKFKL